MKDARKLHILDLCEKPYEALMEILAGLDCSTFTREQAEDYELLDYVIVDSEEEALAAAKDFDSQKNEFSIICLAPVKNARSFLLSDGRLTMDPELLGSKLGASLLETFFYGNFSLHLDESMSGLFKDVEHFKVTNHLALGTSVDELALSSFNAGFNIVAIRSFLDHALIYFAYLKQAGLAGIPFEVEYAASKEYFAVNIHCPVKNFSAEYLLDSFGSVNSKDPIQYLLGVTARAAEFTEITHLEQPGRIALRGFWSKSQSHRLGGLAFNNIKTAAQIQSHLDKKIRAYRAQPSDGVSNDLAEQLKVKSLPGGILAMALSKNESSALNKDLEAASTLIAFVIGRFEEVNEGAELNEMSEGELERILSEYPEQDFITSLSGDDKKELLEKIHKKNISDAYGEEIQRVRDRLRADDDFAKELSDKFSEEVSRRVSGQLDAETLNRILGFSEQDDESVTVGSHLDQDEFKAIVNGVREDHGDDLVQRISGHFEENSGSFKVAISGGEGSNSLGGFFSSAMSSLAGLGLDSRATDFFRSQAPIKITSALKNYAASLGLSMEELNEEQLIEFKRTKLPEAIRETLSDDDSMESFFSALEQNSGGAVPVRAGGFEFSNTEFGEKFKNKLQRRLAEMQDMELGEGFSFTDNDLSKESVQSTISEAMKEAMKENFDFSEGSREEIRAKEGEIVQELSTTLGREELEVAEIVRGGVDNVKEAENQKVVSNLFSEKPGEKEEVVLDEFNQASASSSSESSAEKASGLEETQLMERLKAAELENKKLKDGLSAMEVKLNAQIATNEILEKIDDQAKKELADANADDNRNAFDDIVDELDGAAAEVDVQTLEDLKNGVPIDGAKARAIAQVLEREKTLLKNAREAQEASKKLDIEYKKKESLFLSELRNADRQLKGKESLVAKLKESMQTFSQKKQEEVLKYKQQNEQLNQRLKDDQTPKLMAELKAAKKENESVAKIAEMYKTKVENMLHKKKQSQQGQQAEQLVSENKSLSRLNIQLENKLAAEARGRKNLETQVSKLKDQESKLRVRAHGAEDKLKKALIEIEKHKANEARLVAMNKKKEDSGEGGSTKEVETLKATNAQLQESLQAMAAKLKGDKSQGAGGASSNSQSAKEKHLEQSVRKLNSELSKARKDVTEAKKQMIKMKSEAVSLKNKVKNLERSNGAKKKAA